MGKWQTRIRSIVGWSEDLAVCTRLHPQEYELAKRIQEEQGFSLIDLALGFCVDQHLDSLPQITPSARAFPGPHGYYHRLRGAEKAAWSSALASSIYLNSTLAVGKGQKFRALEYGRRSGCHTPGDSRRHALLKECLRRSWIAPMPQELMQGFHFLPPVPIRQKECPAETQTGHSGDIAN